MRNFVILIVFILSVNVAPTSAQTINWIHGHKYIDFEMMLSPNKSTKGDPYYPTCYTYHGTELITATEEGQIESVKLLISEGTNVNALDSYGNTA